MATNYSTIELQAALNKAQSVKNINNDIDKIKKQIKPFGTSGETGRKVPAELRRH